MHVAKNKNKFLCAEIENIMTKGFSLQVQIYQHIHVI